MSARKKRERLPLLRWRGLLAEFPRKQRLITQAFLVLVSVALIFSQLGFHAVYPHYLLFSSSDGNFFYLVSMLVPVLLGGMLFGPFSGLLTGALSGAALSVHSLTQPLSYIELVALSHWDYVFILGFIGLLSGILFALALRRNPQGGKRVFRIILVCGILSFLFTVAFLANSVVKILHDLATNYSLSGSSTPSNIEDQQVMTIFPRFMLLGDQTLQFIFNGILLAVACCMSDRMVRRLNPNADERPLRLTFSVWLAAVALLGCLGFSAYCVVTLTNREYHETEEYLGNDIEFVGETMSTGRFADAFGSKEAGEVLAILPNDYYDFIIAEGEGDQATILGSYGEQVEPGLTLENTLEPECVAAVQKSLQSGHMETLTFGYIALSTYEGLSIDGDTEISQLAPAKVGYLLARVIEVDLGNGESKRYTCVSMQLADALTQKVEEVVTWSSFSNFAVMFLTYLIITYLLRGVVISPIESMDEKLEAICEGNLDIRIDARGSSEFVALSSGINGTVDALEGFIADAERRNEKELATARAIQSSALPSTFPPFPEIDAFDLYASMDTAREVGGDFYDFFLTGAGTVAFLIADVSGKGIPGALFMMRSKAELKNALLSRDGLGEAVAVANANLCEGNEADMFVTGWVAELDYKSGLLSFVNAGHNPPLLRHDGVWSWITEKSGPILGVIDGASYSTHELTLEPGDQILLYTDGVNEAFNVEHEQFGNERLVDFLFTHPNLGTEELVEALRQEVASWSEGAVQSDDITILALEYHPKS